MKVTLISTVKDCAGSAGRFLDSLAAQTRAPDEVIVVDGGSADGTAEAYARGRRRRACSWSPARTSRAVATSRSRRPPTT